VCGIFVVLVCVMPQHMSWHACAHTLFNGVCMQLGLHHLCLGREDAVLYPCLQPAPHSCHAWHLLVLSGVFVGPDPTFELTRAHTMFHWFAGSWDSTIRAWDVRTQSCIHICSQHHSDVYGLTIHSGCPWLLASASRDSTLRFWDLRGLAAGKLTTPSSVWACKARV
jgi:hypothetical protein